MDTHKKFSPVTICLHWLVAACILFLCGLGIYMVRTESWGLYHIHKSIGLLALLLLVVRLAWRLKNGMPEPAGSYSHAEHVTAKVMHWGLLVGTLALPLTGMLFSAASGHGFGFFGMELFPAHDAAGKPGEVIPLDATLSGLGQALHGWLGYLLLAAVALHVAGALKHHVVDKDMTLARMLGRRMK